MSFAYVAKSKSRLNQYRTSHLSIKFMMLLQFKIIKSLIVILIWKRTLFQIASLTHTHAHVKVNAYVRECTCVLRVHDLCAFTSRDFALTQCQRPVFTTRALFGSRSAEGVHPAYVVNTLTILHEAKAALVCASLPTTFHGSDEERRVCLRQLRPAGMWSRSFTFNRLAMPSSGSRNFA